MAHETQLHFLGNRHLFKRILGYFANYKIRVAIACVAMLLYVPIPAGMGLLTKYITDKVLIAQDVFSLKLCIAGLVGLILLQGIFRFTQAYLMNTAGLLVLKDMRRDLFNKIIRLPMQYFAESEIGMLMSRILNDVTAVRLSLPSLIMLTRQIFTLTGLIAAVIYFDSYLALWSLIIMPAALYPIIFFGKKIRKYGRKSLVELSGVNVVLEESFSGVKVIKAFANEKKELDRFQAENTSLTQMLIRQIFYSETSSRAMDFVAAAAGATVLWVGGMRVVDGIITPGDLTAFLVCLVQLYEPVKKISAANLQIQAGLAGAERVFDIFDSPHIQIENEGETIFENELAELTFENVHFTYPGTSTPAIDNVNLTIKAGQQVAIVGSSGAGKTTLVNLIPRFFDVQDGVIKLNGLPLAEYTLSSLRRQLGLVSQDTFLFNTSVMDNIAYTGNDYSKEAVEAAAKAAYAHDFIMKMGNGYDSVVGEGGVKISGGQKQRLTIARAILKDPKLLILDEATSALDTESERVVQKALGNLMQGRTSIVIAHRLSTVLSSDVIVVMAQGKIIAKGSHKELLSTCPTYKGLYKMQFEDNVQPSEREKQA